MKLALAAAMLLAFIAAATAQAQLPPEYKA
jgi:hypothetical protein